MNTNRLRYFIETVRCGTITEAAHRLYIAQPNLSRQITLLEEELGFPLFLREHRRMELTPAGAYLFDALQDIPDRIAQACQRAGEISRRSKTILNIGFLESEQLIPELVDRFMRFQKEWPDTSVNLERGDFEALRQGLYNGRLDFIMTFSFEVEEMEQAESRILCRQVPALVIQKEHPLAQKETLTVAELADLPIVALNEKQSSASHRIWMDTFRDAGITPNIVRYTHSSEQLLLMVEVGVGATIVDENSRLALSPNVRMVRLPSTDRDPNLCLAWKRDEALGSVKEQFVRIMMGL